MTEPQYLFNLLNYLVIYYSYSYSSFNRFVVFYYLWPSLYFRKHERHSSLISIIILAKQMMMLANICAKTNKIMNN